MICYDFIIFKLYLSPDWYRQLISTLPKVEFKYFEIQLMDVVAICSRVYHDIYEAGLKYI